jgi:hypothetical protein
MATTPVRRRKQARIDRGKHWIAKRPLNASAKEDALDRASTPVVCDGEIDETLRRIGGKGSLKKVFL